MWKNIQIAVNKTKAALNRHGISAHKAEKEWRKQVYNIHTRDGIVPAELRLLIPIPAPEKTRSPSSENLELPQVPSNLLQALLILDPTAINTISTGMSNSQLWDTQSEAGEMHIYTHIGQLGLVEDGFTKNTGIQIRNTGKGGNCNNLSSKSDSDSSYTAYDSIARNADFIVLN